MKIAAVIITYNQANFIVQALDGVFQQVRQADEIVIADDGSTDGTPKIIHDYVTSHGVANKCTLIFLEKNKGINFNLQNAIDHTSAEIIVGFAGDDVSLPNRLEHTEMLFKNNPGVNHIVTAGYVINEHGEKIRNINYNDVLYTDIDAVIKRGMPPVGPFGSAWRRDLFNVFGPIPMNVPNEDDQLEFRGILLGGLLISSTKTYSYRVHGKSASSWLRNKTSDEEFLKLFLKDQLVRHAHMIHWKSALEKIDHCDKFALIKKLEKKSDFYLWLHEIQSASFLSRFLFLLKAFDVLNTRERFYSLFGTNGIIIWRNIRRLARRF